MTKNMLLALALISLITPSLAWSGKAKAGRLDTFSIGVPSKDADSVGSGNVPSTDGDRGLSTVVAGKVEQGEPKQPTGLCVLLIGTGAKFVVTTEDECYHLGALYGAKAIFKG